MTATEASEKCQLLEKLNLDIWHAKTINEANNLRNQFRTCYQDIVKNGFKIIRSKDFKDGTYIPKFKIRNDNSSSMISIIDNRGNGNHKGDCTTRCISFCTGIDYETIQKEQFKNLAKAKIKYNGLTWRSQRIWEKSLISRGFTEISLPRNVSAKVFLRKLKTSGIDTGIIAAKSAHHLAAIDMKQKKILDLWNSAGCRIQTIFVPNEQKTQWTQTLKQCFAR